MLQRGATRDQQARVAESFFIESLRAWFDALELERAVVVAHSLGGFLAALFAAQCAARVERLLLASPVGVPLAPTPVGRTSVGGRLLGALWDGGATPQALLRAMPRNYASSLAQRIGQVILMI